MIRLLEKLPGKVYVALSGGVDSMAALDFMRRGKRSVHALYFDHKTAHGREARSFVEDYCKSSKIQLTVSTLTRDRSTDESLEEFWRNERIRFFKEMSDAPVVTGHHLDDAVEWWIFTSLHGNPRLMGVRNLDTNVVRPFLATPKEELIEWCKKKGVPHIQDPSNESRNYARNKIRHDIMPHALSVNPGLRTTVRNMMLKEKSNGK